MRYTKLMNDQGNFELITKDVAGAVQLLRVENYKGTKVYLMKFGKSLFSYFFWLNDNMWFAHLIIEPEPESGRDFLTDEEVNKATGLIFTGATATIDIQLAPAPTTEVKENEERKVS